MKEARLSDILRSIARTRILVLGDFFLDQYWSIDPSLTESSIETGLDAFQVTQVRCSPGAAGTVTSNLVALGVSEVSVIGVTGDDGNGYSLRQYLKGSGVNTDYLISSPERLTPTYTKPMSRSVNGQEEEMNRFDIKNHTCLPVELEVSIIGALMERIDSVDGIAVMDQVPEENCGVVSTAVRESICQLAESLSEKPILVDSRVRIGLFHSTHTKPNLFEAREALGVKSIQPSEAAKAMYERTERPVFLTLGAKGIGVYDGQDYTRMAAVQQSGPLDIVGAGDSASAAILSSLCAGASLTEAAKFGNLAAAVTVKKLGTTGTATPSELLSVAGDHFGWS